MQSFLDIDQALRKFYTQGDQGTLVISCRGADLVIPSKLLLGQMQQGEMAILLGVGACPSVEVWLDGLVASVAADLELASATRKAQGRPGFDPLPLDAQDQRLAPEKRLEVLVRHCTQVMDPEVSMVWGLLPLNCEDLAGYHALVDALLSPQDWSLGHRFVLWDDADAPGLVPRLLQDKNQYVAVLELDASPPKLLDNLAASIADPLLPATERVNNVFQLAAVDDAYQRHDEALAKYRWVFAQEAGQNEARQALCLQGAGDIALKTGLPAQALRYFQSALGTLLSAETPQPAVLAPVLMGAGQACLKLQDWGNAVGYFDYANRMAAKNLNPFAKADALEMRGHAQGQAAMAQVQDPKQGAAHVREALASYKACRGLCCQYGYASRWEGVMQAELALVEQVGLRSETSRARTLLARGFEQAVADHRASTLEDAPASSSQELRG